MKAWGVTDVGLRRQENQDTFAIERCSHLFAVVCDGMGGANAGRLAGSLAARCFSDGLLASLAEGMTHDEIAAVSVQSVKSANAAVYARAIGDESCAGMGTTLVSAVLYDGGAVICNVGDSRAYLLRAEGIERITRDHSVVENLISKGELTPEEARTHPNRNIITRALGPEPEVECDVYNVPLRGDEALLLCSDGLIVTLRDEEIFETVRSAADPHEALTRLVEGAYAKGAPDNVTAVLIADL